MDTQAVGLQLPAQSPIGATPAPAPVTLSPERGNGLVAIVGADALVKAEQEAAKAGSVVQPPAVVDLGGYVEKCFTTAYRERIFIEQKMLKAQRNVNGQYDPEVLSAIKEYGGSQAFVKMTSTRCTAAKSWLTDIIFAQDEDSFGIDPTPIPDLSPEDTDRIARDAVAKIAEQTGGVPPQDPMQAYELASQLRDQQMHELNEDAKKKAMRMETRIKDQLVEGGYQRAMAGFIQNLIQAPCGVLKGPVVRMRKRLRWKGNEPAIDKTPVVEFDSVDPMDFYPSPKATCVERAGYIIERIRMSRSDLVACKGIEGWNDAAIDAVLNDSGYMGTAERTLWTDTQREMVKTQFPTHVTQHSDAEIEALEFWGSIQGKLLLDYGMSPDAVPNPLDEYEVCIVKAGGYVIKALLNPDPLGRRPYYVSSFIPVAGSIWGISLPECIEDLQEIENTLIRHGMNNHVLSSGPQIGVDARKLQSGVDPKQMRAFKVWMFENLEGNSPPIQFFQPQSTLSASLNAFKYFDAMIDDVSGVPKYSYGNNAGAPKTASGLSMMLEAASKRIKLVLALIDTNVIIPLLERLYTFNMLYDEDDGIKGDLRVVARGSRAINIKAMQQEGLKNFASLTSNPVDLQIMGVKGRASLIRAIATSLGVKADDVVPTEIELQQREEAAKNDTQAQAQAAQQRQPQVPQPANQPQAVQ